MPFSFGIEEEYFLVDRDSKAVTRKMPDGFFAAAREALGDSVAGEFLQSQIEIVTKPHDDVAAARAELRHLRTTLGDIASQHGLAILAAGTHPTAIWERSRQSEGERYDNVMDDLQMIGRRNMLCGMHVHVEMPDPRKPRRRDDAHSALCAVADCAVDIVAVLAFLPDRIAGLPARGL